MHQLRYIPMNHNTCIQYTHHAVSWTMESKPRVATHLFHVCACGFDTSKIHINTFIIHVSLCIKAAVVIHTHGQLCRFLY